jgi:uncharacterized membrane protein
MGFSVSVNKDIERWEKAGLIDHGTAQKLLIELETRPGRFGLGAVLAILGSILLGAALLTFIAANWEAFPRLVRVALIFVGVIGGYLLGAWREGSDDKISSGALYIFAATAFGGGIALIGQMYHLSGDGATAALVWSVATLVAALLLLSGNLAAMAGLIGLFYLTLTFSEVSWHSTYYVWIVPVLSLAVAIAARLTHTRLGLHSATWLILAMFVVMRLDHDLEQLDYAFALGGAALFILFALFEDAVESVTDFARALQFYALAVSLVGFAAIQIEGYDNNGLMIIIGVLIIALTIAALALKGRVHRPVRNLAYLAFALEVLYLANVTIGSIIGQSAFFFLIGIFVILLAFLVVRIEKKFKLALAGDAR